MLVILLLRMHYHVCTVATFLCKILYFINIMANTCTYVHIGHCCFQVDIAIIEKHKNSFHCMHIHVCASMVFVKCKISENIIVRLLSDHYSYTYDVHAEGACI